MLVALASSEKKKGAKATDEKKKGRDTTQKKKPRQDNKPKQKPIQITQNKKQNKLPLSSSVDDDEETKSKLIFCVAVLGGPVRRTHKTFRNRSQQKKKKEKKRNRVWHSNPKEIQKSK